MIFKRLFSYEQVLRKAGKTPGSSPFLLRVYRISSESMADNPFEIENKTGDGIEAAHGGNTTPARLNLANLAIDAGDTFTRSNFPPTT